MVRSLPSRCDARMRPDVDDEVEVAGLAAVAARRRPCRIPARASPRRRRRESCTFRRSRVSITPLPPHVGARPASPPDRCPCTWRTASGDARSPRSVVPRSASSRSISMGCSMSCAAAVLAARSAAAAEHLVQDVGEAAIVAACGAPPATPRHLEAEVEGLARLAAAAEREALAAVRPALVLAGAGRGRIPPAARRIPNSS